MLGLTKRASSMSYGKDIIDVGWLNTDQTAGCIWYPPQQNRRDDPKPAHAKAVNRCPAVVDFETRGFDVLCPYDLRLGIGAKDGKPVLINRDGANASIGSKHLMKAVTLLGRDQWRSPRLPVLQFRTPYIFVADDPVFINQFPPFGYFRRDPLPGLVIGGRFPIDVWPRHLNWAFEWHDASKDLVLRRGEPWFTVRFECANPAARYRLVEAERTPELDAYTSNIAGVTNYVRGTFSLFGMAESHRPKKLLKAK